MARVEDSIDIRAPAQVVFAAVTDPRRTLEWNSNIVSIDDVAGLPVGIGTSWTQVASIAGRSLTVSCTIVDYRPPHEGVLEVRGEYGGRIITRCHEHSYSTHLTQVIEFEPPRGLMGQMAMAMIVPRLKREIRQTLLRQRDVLERETQAAGGSRAD